MLSPAVCSKEACLPFETRATRCIRLSASGVRVFTTFAVQEGRTANEIKFGTTNKRKQMADFMKDQKQVRKKSYAADTREAKSNEIWTGKEGLDGITSLPINKDK